MAFDHSSATDALLGAFLTTWTTDAAALNGGTMPTFVDEIREPDLKPHPRDTGKAWVRVVVRHNDSRKVSIAGDKGTSKYRRLGLVWAQVFVPATSAETFTIAQQLGQLALSIYEGQRFGPVVILKASLYDRPRDGGWWIFDVKAEFYWDVVV